MSIDSYQRHAISCASFSCTVTKLYKLVMQIYQFARQQAKLWSSYSISEHIFPLERGKSTRKTEHIFVKDSSGEYWETLGVGVHENKSHVL